MSGRRRAEAGAVVNAAAMAATVATVVTGARTSLSRWPSTVEGPVVSEPLSRRGLLWISYIATMYYLMSNPLVLVPAAEVSILYGCWATIVVILVERKRIRLPVVPWSVALFVGLGVVSFLWSMSRDDTWSIVRLTVVIAALALLIVSNVNAKIVAYGIGVGGAVIMGLSLLTFWLELPGSFTATLEGTQMAGVGTNRNTLAYSVVPALAAVCAIRPTARWEWPAVAVLFFANVWGVWVAVSGTGFLAAGLVIAVAIGLWLAVAVRRLVGRWGAGGVLALMAVGSTLAAINLDSLARLVGKDLDTLSGRRPLWDAIIHASERQPIQGYGFGAVWNHPWHFADANQVLVDINFEAGFPFAHGHNSFLDLLPELGILGCVALLLLYVQGLGRAIRVIVTSDDASSLETARLVALVCVGHFASGLSEPLATVPFGWYVLVLVVGMSIHLGPVRFTTLRVPWGAWRANQPTPD